MWRFFIERSDFCCRNLIGILIGISASIFKNVERIEPKDFEHQGNMDDWLIIEKIEDVVVGTSIPYNYDKTKF